VLRAKAGQSDPTASACHVSVRLWTVGGKAPKLSWRQLAYEGDFGTEGGSLPMISEIGVNTEASIVMRVDTFTPHVVSTTMIGMLAVKTGKWELVGRVGAV